MHHSPRSGRGAGEGGAGAGAGVRRGCGAGEGGAGAGAGARRGRGAEGGGRGRGADGGGGSGAKAGVVVGVAAQGRARGAQPASRLSPRSDAKLVGGSLAPRWAQEALDRPGEASAPPVSSSSESLSPMPRPSSGGSSKSRMCTWGAAQIDG